MTETIEIPPGVSAEGTLRVTFVPALADPSAPTLAEVSAGTDLTCYFQVGGFSQGGEQATVEDLRLCSAQATESLGRYKATIDPIVYVFDPQDPENNDLNNAAYAALAPGLNGYIVVRMGIPHETAWASGQYVWVDPVTLGERVPLPREGNENEKYKIRQSVAVRGNRRPDILIAA